LGQVGFDGTHRARRMWSANSNVLIIASYKMTKMKKPENLRISNLTFIEGLLQIQSLADILDRKQGMV